MLVNICMKFHEGTLIGFWVTERTWPYRKIYYFQFQRAITPKICNPELGYLRSAHRLMLLYICVKFHENISNVFSVTERTRFCDRRSDDPGKNSMFPYPKVGGRHNLCNSPYFTLKRIFKCVYYHNDPKFSDRYAWANSADRLLLFAIPSVSFGLIILL